MSGTTMIVLIVLISVGSGVVYDMYKKHLEFKHKMQNNNSDAHKQLAETNAQVLALKAPFLAAQSREQLKTHQ
ncbi:MAG: hypothetical protein ACKVJ5_18435 [Pseudoalteromonas sp.]